MIHIYISNGIFIFKITQEEKDELREELRVSIPKITNVDTTEFYKVSFKKVCDLVRTRKAFLKKGIAYISQADLGSLFVTYYKQILAKGLAVRICLFLFYSNILN